MKRQGKKPPRTDDPKLMAISEVNGKRDANGKQQTIVVARQSNKLARRMVRAHVLKDKSSVGKGLASMREPQPRSLHPHEKRALRKAELERRAQAQVLVGDDSSAALDEPELLALANEPQGTEHGDQSADSDGGSRDE